MFSFRRRREEAFKKEESHTEAKPRLTQIGLVSALNQQDFPNLY